MRAFKKFIATLALLCAAAVSVFAGKSEQELKNLLDEIVERENSGVLVATQGKSVTSSDGSYTYFSDENGVYLVKSSGNLLYEYTRISSGLVYVVFAEPTEKNKSYFSYIQSQLADMAPGSGIFSNDFEEILEEDLSEYTVAYRELVKIGGRTYTAILTDFDSDRNYGGLDFVAPAERTDAATETKSEPNHDMQNEDSQNQDEEDTGAPSQEILESLFKHIVQMESSGKIVDSNNTGVWGDGYTYSSDGTNHYVIQAGWDIPFEYDLLTSTDEDYPNILYVIYGHDNEEDRGIFETQMSSLVDFTDEHFFDLVYADVYESIMEYTITYHIDRAEINGVEYEVLFTDINDDLDEPELPSYTDSLDEEEESVPPTDEELHALLNYIVDLEKSGKLVDTGYEVVSEDEYSYISDGKNLYLINDSYDIPFEYDRIRSDVPGVPNIMFVLHGHDSGMDHYYYLYNRSCFNEMGSSEDFFDVDLAEAYTEVLSYPHSLDETVVVDGIEYRVIFTNLNAEDDYVFDDYLDDEYDFYDYLDDEYSFEDYLNDEELNDGRWDDDYGFDDYLDDEITDDAEDDGDDWIEDEIPALDRAGIEKLVDDLVARMNGRGYPSLFKTDKPYIIKQDGGVYILRTEGYTAHIDVSGDYLYTAQLYTEDFQNGLMVIGFARNNIADLDYLTELGEYNMDESSIEAAHMNGDLVVTQGDMDEYLDAVNENGYVFDKVVVVDGVEYHVYCIPLNESDWTAN